MKIIRNIQLLKECISKYRELGGDIGFVPTMGALHEGHISLLKKSIIDNDYTICSIYINPKQFNDKSDLVNYPRDEINDIKKIKKLNCDILFFPLDSEINQHPGLIQHYDFTDCFNKLEGEKRPGHFLGVVTILDIFFNIIRPNTAYFGEKDYQQFWIIKLFQKSYNLPLEIKSSPTIRNHEGLALSSRNQHLNDRQKKMASSLFKSLQLLKNKIELYYNNNRGSILKPHDLSALKKIAITPILNNRLIKLDYFEIIESENFSFVNSLSRDKTYRVLIAAYIGDIRLIDNISLN